MNYAKLDPMMASALEGEVPMAPAFILTESGISVVQAQEVESLSCRRIAEKVFVLDSPDLDTVGRLTELAWVRHVELSQQMFPRSNAAV